MKRFFIVLFLLFPAAVFTLQAQEEKTPWESRQEARNEAYWQKEQIKMHAQAVKKTREPVRERQLVDYLWGVDDPRVTRQGDSLVLVVMPVREKDLSAWVGKSDKYTSASNDPQQMLWVSLDPELGFILKHEPLMDSASVAVCIKQLTGRAPQEEYPYIVSFWVSPRQLFRPTPDPNPATHFSTVLYPDDVDPAHKAWMENYKNIAYDLRPPHAWTRLGYACDWGNSGNPVGVSEFVVKPDTPIHVEDLSTIWLWYSEQMPAELFDIKTVSAVSEK